MIILKLSDGLGNQMFQYAFARYLQSVYDEEIIFETTKLGNRAVRSYGLDKLNLNSNCRLANKFENIIFKCFSKFVRVISSKIFKISQNNEEGYRKMIRFGFYTTEEAIKYFQFEKCRLPIKVVRGFFQSPKYFNEIEDIIRKEFVVTTECNNSNLCLIKELNSCESVCVHIRRGDYVNNHKFYLCREQYYIKAMNYCIKNLDNPQFYIFSNSSKDLEWIKNNYNLPGKKVYVNVGEDEFDDLRLMYNCRNFIISNSTFSWWASYLSKNDNKLIVAPSRWYNTNEDVEDIYCKEWKLIDV